MNPYKTLERVDNNNDRVTSNTSSDDGKDNGARKSHYEFTVNLRITKTVVLYSQLV